MAPLIEHNRGYLSSLVAEEEPSRVKMQVPSDEQQEQKEQESGVNQTLE